MRRSDVYTRLEHWPETDKAEANRLLIRRAACNKEEIRCDFVDFFENYEKNINDPKFAQSLDASENWREMFEQAEGKDTTVVEAQSG